MLELVKAGGIGLVGFGLVRFFQLNYSVDIVVILTVVSGVLCTLGGYTKSIFALFSPSVVNGDINTTLTNAEQVDVQCIRHLSARFDKAHDNEALSLLRKLNDRLFSLHHPEKTNATVNS